MTTRGRVAGVENDSPHDVDALLEFIGDVLPTGANEWESVRHSYEDYAVETNRAERELVSLKKTFQALLNVKKSTGDPRCPENVRVARQIQRRIEEKVSMENDVGEERALSNEEDSHSTTSHAPLALGENEGDNYMPLPVCTVPEFKERKQVVKAANIKSGRSDKCSAISSTVNRLPCRFISWLGVEVGSREVVLAALTTTPLLGFGGECKHQNEHNDLVVALVTLLL